MEALLLWYYYCFVVQNENSNFRIGNYAKCHHASVLVGVFYSNISMWIPWCWLNNTIYRWYFCFKMFLRLTFARCVSNSNNKYIPLQNGYDVVYEFNICYLSKIWFCRDSICFLLTSYWSCLQFPCYYRYSKFMFK